MYPLLCLFFFQMGLSRCNRLLAAFALLFALVYGWKCLFESRRPPCYSVDVKYFGVNVPSSNDEDDFSIKPFKVPFERSQVDDVTDRLTKARFYEPTILIDHRDVNQSTYGFSRKTAESVRDYFINTFDWKKKVQELNTFDHYRTSISVGLRVRSCFSHFIRLLSLSLSQGLNIHFVRVTHDSPTNEKKDAILLLHGWPGSFIEYLDVARLLNSSSSSTFDIIIPSLPGYGYSDAAVRSGMDTAQIARIMQSLMQRLGYSSYVVCGGDWGAFIGTMMAQLYPGHVRGLLLTMISPSLTWKQFVHMALGYYVSPSILLDYDEQEYLNHRYNPYDFLKLIL